MKPRHAAALALWASRIVAAIIIAIPIARWANGLDARSLNWISENPSAFLEYQQKIHSHSGALNFSALSICGIVYFGLVEGLAWCLRKIADHTSAEFRTDN